MVVLFALTIFLAFYLLLSMRHCHLKRGGRLTFTFFFFGFLYISRWVIKNMGPSPEYLKTARCSIFSARTSLLSTLSSAKDPAINFIHVLLVHIVIIIGWLCLFYAGWWLAERIMRHFDILQKRLFPTLLLSSFITASIAYPIEATGSSIGWWWWQLPAKSFDIFFIGCPAQPMRAEFYSVLLFLAAYFLIECSRFRHKSWRMLFFLLPFVHFFTITFFGHGLPRAIERLGIFITILILTFFSKLSLENTGEDDLSTLKSVEDLLSIALISLLSLSCLVHIFIIQKPLLVFSALPAFFFYLLSIKKELFVLVLIFSVALLFLGKTIAAPLMVPISIFLVFKASDHYQKRVAK